MRVHLAVVLSLGVLVSQPALGEQTFPYTGYVTAENVYVRSGPGRNYYPTGKLRTGEKVEIYRHDPGGWYAIRPVEGSFSWVCARYLQIDEDGLAKVSGDRVAARVGSEFSNIREVIQVRLHQGELVEVLDEKQLGSDPESGTWYKIAPPSGEFRWVFGKFVDPNYHHSGIRKVPAEYHPLVGPGQPAADRVAATGGQTPAAGSDRPDADGQPASAPSASDVRTADHWSASSGPTPEGPPQERPGGAAVASTDRDRPQTDAEAGYTNRFVEPAHDPAGSVTLRRLSPEEFQAQLEEIDVELSIMLAEEPTVWKLDDLVLQTQSLLAEAETAVERGRVRLLSNKLAQSEDVKRRYDAVNGTQMATERRNGQLSKLAQARRSTPPEPAPGSRFDGVGRLARVMPPKLGAPRFALVDENGDVRCYVTPAPGLNLNYYIGRHVGVNGARGYIADKRIQHVTAKHVTPLATTRIR